MKSIKTISRLSRVVQVLYKHGLGRIVKESGLGWHLPFRKRLFTAKSLPPDLPKRLREAMEELGGAYIKLGQLLSIRPDLVPPQYCEEFCKLLDQVPEDPYTELIPIIEQELGNAGKIFSHIDHKALGSASVAQVHKARLKSGVPVAIKIQRPDAQENFKTDIQILKIIANKINKHIRNHIDLVQIVEEFEKYTLKELDFTYEGEALDKIRSEIKNKKLVVPKVNWAYTTKKVLTMDYLDGIPLKKAALSKENKKKIAELILDTALTQVFDTGDFHADLHPGNILVLKNGKIGLLDFGITGKVSKRVQQLGLKLYLGIINGNADGIVDTLLSYGEPSAETDIRAFKYSVKTLLSKWSEDSSTKRVTNLMYDLFSICATHDITLPSEVVVLGKALVTVESTARTLDPTFNFVTYSQTRVTKLLKKHKVAKKAIDEYIARSKELTKHIVSIPQKGASIIDKLDKGEFKIGLRDKDFRHIGMDIGHSSNRLSYALISASCILAGSRLVDVGPRVMGYSVLALSTFAVATIFVIFLATSVLREGKAPYDPHRKSPISDTKHLKKAKE